MKIHKISELDEQEVTMEGAKDVTITILAGPRDGSEAIVMRLFRVMPGGYTPFHSHDFEHLVKINKGKGVMVDENENEHEVDEGFSAFVKPGEMHQFRNKSDSIFEFICVIPGGVY